MPDAIQHCTLTIGDQLADIASLEDGWLDGYGTGYSEAFIVKALSVFNEVLRISGVRVPHLYPTPEGGVRAEWDEPGLTIVLTFEAAGEFLRLITYDDDRAEHFTFNVATEIEDVAADLKRLMSEATC